MDKDTMTTLLEEEGVSGISDIAALASLGNSLVNEITKNLNVEKAILDLDEEVHRCMDDNSGTESQAESSAHASYVNNQGLQAQVACILAGYGVAEGQERICQAVGLHLTNLLPGR